MNGAVIDDRGASASGKPAAVSAMLGPHVNSSGASNEAMPRRNELPRAA